MSTLTLAVVGHPNKGKSSIVATLSRHSDIAITARSGTTTHSHYYDVMANDQLLYQLVDTPGFQRPRRALDWLQQHDTNAAQRPTVVRAFVEAFSGQRVFRDEVELLSPIIDGAGIIYVADGGIPYSPEYEADMEILRWSGQPRMALINPIGANTYTQQWRQALDQYFNLVKVFNPLTASYAQQCDILQAFKRLAPTHHKTIDTAITQLQQQRLHQHQQAAGTITQHLCSMLHHQVTRTSTSEADARTVKVQVREEYEQAITGIEYSCREQLLQIYQHENVAWQEAQLQLQQLALFDQSHWNVWGLDRKRVIGLSISAGALAGAAIDVGLGGSSLMTGALAGGLLSGVSSVWLANHAFKIKAVGRGQLLQKSQQQWQLGPIKDPQFAFVLLGRALFYQQAVAGRTHAQKQPLSVNQHMAFDWLQGLDKQAQVKLTYYLKKAATGSLSEKHQQALADLVARLIEQLQQSSNNAR